MSKEATEMNACLWGIDVAIYAGGLRSTATKWFDGDVEVTCSIYFAKTPSLSSIPRLGHTPARNPNIRVL